MFVSTLLVLSLAAVAASATTLLAGVKKSSLAIVEISEYRLTPSLVAIASFDDALNETGWGQLNIKTNSDFEDGSQAFAAGLLEGYLTAKHIYYTQENIAYSVFHKTVPPKKVQEFMTGQDAYTREQIAANPDKPFYRQLKYLMKQYDGLVAGYHKNDAVPPLPIWAFQLLNGVGDLFDIIPAVQRSARQNWDNFTKEEAELQHAKQGHCSALIKLTGNFSDLFMSHSSWWVYENTDRIFKHYELNFHDDSTAAKGISFSSYPGFLESLDDFYMLSSGLAWTQTTNGIIDHNVYDGVVTPKSLLAWQRVRVASAMASTGPEWHKFFSTDASGTYANQYMIVDFNLFKPGKVLEDNLLFVVEEMPGLIIGKDQTEVLRQGGYWSSYNIPFYPEIFERSGYTAQAKRHGTAFTHSLAPRAEIFRRDQGTVKDIESLKVIMRSNDYLVDPYSKTGPVKNPLYAICSRGDLMPKPTNSPFGCYDTKATSYLYGVLDRKATIVNGPTRNPNPHAENYPPLPAFTWEDYPHANHFGLPAKYEFDFVHTEPATGSGASEGMSFATLGIDETSGLM